MDIVTYAVPTVIRAKTFMCKEDFDKWAEDIKKQNKSIVCIPCDAEVVSAEAEQEAVPTVVRVTMSDGSQYYLEHERDAIPTVSADRPQGEWKHTITWQPYCSNCEYVFDEDEEYSPFWKYCPMCGARMKGGDDE